MAADPQLDGKPLPTGFGVAVNAALFRELGQAGPPRRPRPHPHRPALERAGANLHPWERDFLVLREYLPAGTTLVEGSVQTQAVHYELSDGVLTFYFAPGQLPRYTYYDVFGYLPGKYRTLPSRAVERLRPRHAGISASRAS